MSLFDESFTKEPTNIEEFTLASIDALREINKTAKEGNPYKYEVWSKLPYKKTQFISLGETTKSLGSKWQLLVLSIDELKQNKNKGNYSDSFTLQLKATIIEPKKFKPNQIFLAQMYITKIPSKPKTLLLGLALKDKQGAPYAFVKLLPIKEIPNLAEIEKKIKAKL
jgi:hypothetical protein